MRQPEQLDIVDMVEAVTGVKHTVASPLTTITEPVNLYECDCREALATLADNSLDSCVTDPPYALVSIVKRFGKQGSAPCKTYEGKSGAYERASRGFMQKLWDNGDVSHDVEFWREVYRVLKPGGFVLAFGGTRTYHRLACAIEDAGFEIRDMVQWLYSMGFPKGHNVTASLVRLAICQSPDSAALAVQRSAHTQVRCDGMKEPIAVASALILPEARQVLLTEIGGVVALHDLTDTWPSEWETRIGLSMMSSWNGSLDDLCDETSKYITATKCEMTIETTIWNWLIGLHTSANTIHASVTLQNGLTWPAIIAASSLNEDCTNKPTIQLVTALGSATANPLSQFNGFNLALKPANEPICMARKPLSEKTVAANVLRWGTGAINVDGCRIDGKPWKEHIATGLGTVKFFSEGDTPEILKSPHEQGRWPANVITDGSDEVVAMLPNTKSGANNVKKASGADQSGNRGPAYGQESRSAGSPMISYGDSGSVARFWYQAKATKKERAGSNHPTVKPIALMRYLTRLVTPPGGIVLDPFAGTGTTGEACHLEGFKVVMIEREADYAATICARMRKVLHGEEPSDANPGSNDGDQDAATIP